MLVLALKHTCEDHKRPLAIVADLSLKYGPHLPVLFESFVFVCFRLARKWYKKVKSSYLKYTPDLVILHSVFCSVFATNEY